MSTETIRPNYRNWQQSRRRQHEKNTLQTSSHLIRILKEVLCFQLSTFKMSNFYAGLYTAETKRNAAML